MASRRPGGPLWRSLTGPTITARSLRSASGLQPMGLRHASTKAALSKGEKGKAPSPSPPPAPRAEPTRESEAPSLMPLQKPRRLPAPSPGRGVKNEHIDEARRSMQMRRMPSNVSEFKWLREARTELYTLVVKQKELSDEQRKISSDINRHYQRAGTPTKKGKPTKDDGVKDAGAKSTADEPSEDAQDTASKEAEPGKEEGEDKVKQMRARAKKIKVEIDANLKQQEAIRSRSAAFRLGWPNNCHPDVPIGPEENAVLVSVQDPLNLLPPEFDLMKESWTKSAIQAKDFPDGPAADPRRQHLYVAHESTNAEVDSISGLLTTGSSWPYLLGSISLLEHALTQYAMSIVVSKGFLAVSPPDVVRADLADRCGFRPRDEKAKQTYFLDSGVASRKEPASSQQQTQGEEQQKGGELCLAATAEIPLAGLLAGRVFGTRRNASTGPETSMINALELPIKLVGLGHAFRAEAGARGADTRGLYRVHQFSKIEMFVATEGEEKKSNAMLEELRGIQEEVIGGLGLPFRVLDMPTEELGASAYRKYDIEVWMPGRGSWGEVSSASNCTSYQAQRLSIRQVRDELGGSTSNASDAASTTENTAYEERSPALHTLNATAAAIPRLIVAILENHGVEEGKLKLPDTLKPFWLAGEHDANVTWVHTGKLNAHSKSRMQRALAQVRSIAQKNGTDAPTMVASFVILHELTALVPLVVLFYVFGALGVGTAVLQWLVGDSEQAVEGDGAIARFRAWARQKEERFERYCRKKGYLGFDKQEAEAIDQTSDVGDTRRVAASFANMVAAYILVKALIPVRIGASVALAGPFSRSVLEPFKRVTRRVFGRRTPGTPA